MELLRSIFTGSVILLQMNPSLSFGDKSFVAYVTSKLFFPQMPPLHVHVLGREGGKRHITIFTLVRFLAGVCAAVGVVAEFLAEPLPAKLAGIRLLPCMDSVVLLQVLAGAESFGTVFASQGFLVMNVFDMGGKISFVLLNYSAMGTPRKKKKKKKTFSQGHT